MNDKAKQIFINYNGSKSFMMNDGVLDEYRKYNVSPKMERKWCVEIMNELRKKIFIESNKVVLMQLLAEYCTYSNQISIDKTINFLTSLYDKYNDCYDTETCVRIISKIFDLVKIKEADNSGKEILIKYIVSELQKLLKKDVTISEDYYINGRCPSYLSEENVRDGIINDIAFYSKEL